MAYHGLEVTYCDAANNQFLTLGGAAWRTKRERDAAFASIPTVDGDSLLIVDVVEDQGIGDDRPVSVEIVERLLGEPMQILINKARARQVA